MFVLTELSWAASIAWLVLVPLGLFFACAPYAPTLWSKVLQAGLSYGVLMGTVGSVSRNEPFRSLFINFAFGLVHVAVAFVLLHVLLSLARSRSTP